MSKLKVEISSEGVVEVNKGSHSPFAEGLQREVEGLVPSPTSTILLKILEYITLHKSPKFAYSVLLVKNTPEEVFTLRVRYNSCFHTRAPTPIWDEES
jgi:hypothetical protein